MWNAGAHVDIYHNIYEKWLRGDKYMYIFIFIFTLQYLKT